MMDVQSPNPVENQTAPSADGVDAATPHDAAPLPESAPPMTGTLLARLFIVPAVLVSLLVVGLVVVVVLFGWSSVGQRPAMKDLLASIEADTGDRQAGVLFPQSKEMWLAAKELAERLRRRDQELKPAELGPTAARLAAIVAPLETSSTLTDGQRLKGYFVLVALGQLGTPEAGQALIAAVDSKEPSLRQAALRGLVEMHAQPSARAGLPRVVAAMNDASPEVRLIACTAVSQLAEAGDRTATDALAGKLSEDREMQWNAAIGLARLGSPRGKLVLLSMLDRAYWEKNRVSYTTPQGQAVERAFTPGEVENYVGAAVDAAARLNDADLRAVIERLKNDPSVVVREHAARALASERKP